MKPSRKIFQLFQRSTTTLDNFLLFVGHELHTKTPSCGQHNKDGYNNKTGKRLFLYMTLYHALPSACVRYTRKTQTEGNLYKKHKVKIQIMNMTVH